MTVAFVFPGQGSQSLGMQQELASIYGEVQATYSEASEVLGYDLWELVQGGPAERLNDTVVTQPAMLTAGVAAWRVWKAAGGVTPAMLAGHSLGEYSALVCAGGLPFADAVGLVLHRATLMQEAVPDGQGVMAALIGLDDEQVLQVCADASEQGVAEAVNFNAPGQVVIAGARVAIERAIALATEAGARRAILLPVSVPAHSSMMQPAGDALVESLNATDFHVPEIPVIRNVDALPYQDAEDIRDKLRLQLFNPVRWVDTINHMTGNGADVIIECGPGKVLAGLTKRISRQTPAAYIDTTDSLQSALEKTH